MYFLTLNQKQSDEGNQILGIVFATIGSFLQGVLQINIRVMSVSNMSWAIRPACNGIIHTLFVIFLINLHPGIVKIMEYNISDIIVLSLSGLGGTIAMGTLN